MLWLGRKKELGDSGGGPEMSLGGFLGLPRREGQWGVPGREQR